MPSINAMVSVGYKVISDVHAGSADLLDIYVKLASL